MCLRLAIRRAVDPRGVLVAFGVMAGPSLLAQSPQIVQLNAAQVWRRVEFQVNSVPTATNRFDADLIRLDATFTAPVRRIVEPMRNVLEEVHRAARERAHGVRSRCAVDSNRSATTASATESTMPTVIAVRIGRFWPM